MNYDISYLLELEQELIALRRDLHKHPESGWTEFYTTARIVDELEALGLSVQYGPSIHVREKMFGFPKAERLHECFARAAKDSSRPDIVRALEGGFTGCAALIKGALPGPKLAFRFDIDANDLTETEDETHLPCRLGFRSGYAGCMHACGHDAHAAIGVGLAKLLVRERARLRGSVLLLFQPGEEGLRGAASMTASGLLSDCDYLFSAHVGLFPDKELGTVVASAHGFLASTKFDVAYTGKAVHAAAAPEKGRNALAAAATAALHMLAIPPHHEGITRINVGTLHAGSGRNVIPAHAELAVETRGESTQLDEYMHQTARRICLSAGEMYGCDCEIKLMGSAGTADCDEALVSRIIPLLAKVDGVTDVLPDVNFGAGEDVTTMMREVQSHGGQATEMVLCMPLKAAHHNEHFDIDERVILLGVKVFASIALALTDY